MKCMGLWSSGTAYVTFEDVKVPVENLFAKPVHLNWEQAAAIPLAALTSYRALFTKGKAKKAVKFW